MAVKNFDLDIPIKQGVGSESIKVSTFGVAINSSAVIKHGMQRICPPTPNDPEEKWEIELYVDNKLVHSEKNIENGQTVTANNITTKFLGKTEFRVKLKFSQQWDFTAKIKLTIKY